MSDNLSENSIKEQFKSNTKLKYTTYVVGGLAVLSIVYFSYKQFIFTPSNEKSKEAYFEGLNYADKDSVDVAIETLSPVVKKFDGKVGGEVAQFTLARQYMAKGEFKKALENLEGVHLEDTYLSVMSIGLQGDCKSEMEQYEEAASLYIMAADKDDNTFTTPTYLFKAAFCAEKVNDYETALQLYRRIQNNYTEFSNQKSIKKYIARATKTKK
jgi:predicted negative regulator of RcsB-dependent stress response